MATDLIVRNKFDSTTNKWSIWKKINKLFIGLTIVWVIMRPTEVKRKLLRENRLGSKGKYQGKGESSARSLSQTTCMMKKDLHIYTHRLSHETTSYQAEINNSSVYCFVNGALTPRWTVAEHDQKTEESMLSILPQTQHLLLPEDIAECFWYLAGHCQARFHPWSFCGSHC